jgi:succinate-semialdehyde dehydrogenase/glutarate-semialdehyde dehydrogenase
MELGGSDAFIVLEDADLDHTIPWAVWGRMYNTGQTCCAAKRFIVVDASPTSSSNGSRRRSERAQGRRSDGREDDARSAVQRSGLVQLLEAGRHAVAKGAKLLIGGKRIDRPGSYMEPTILTDIKPDNPAFRDEFFGPVALFFRVKDEAPPSRWPMTPTSASAARSGPRTSPAASGSPAKVETGMMFINNIDWSDAELPFGGIKNSGYGRELGDMGIQEFVNKKLVRTANEHAPA